MAFHSVIRPARQADQVRGSSVAFTFASPRCAGPVVRLAARQGDLGRDTPALLGGRHSDRRLLSTLGLVELARPPAPP